ncbi:MAG: cytochrome c biogenesis heme-transporting ATPase CcmA [Nitrosomonas sp.]|nr:cytochrome c biogenesis heme-transporting ATPase CcmA [Nitrosomonas sp.]MDP1951575.1 cytochrome c biogenesis heme-transporting ATPase CcmA [Nitrosomonas sp.]
MLRGNDLVCVRGDRRLFEDVNFFLDAGGIMRVSGPNGSGKTSLLRMLCGLSLPAHGEISWRGTAIRSLGGEYYNEVTYLGHLAGVKDELTAIENLRISSALAGAEIGEDKAREVLQYVGLGGRELLPVKVLSQGQKKRVALARLLVSSTALWILDEPLVALDTSAIKMIKDLLEQHLAQGGMVVMTTHQEIDIAAATIQQLQLA